MIVSTPERAPELRILHADDWDQVWAFSEPVLRGAATYAYPPEVSKSQFYESWVSEAAATYVALIDGEIVGTYYLKANRPGQGSHVCNAGYITAEYARGRGIATAMCEHSQQVARQLGFLAMQFNLVVSTNQQAVQLWQKLGFEIVGSLPKAFCHPVAGLVDAHIMYKWLR